MQENAKKEALALYGTAQPPAPVRTETFGDWTLAYSGGGLRYIRFRGVEVVRGVDFVARNAAWGAFTPRLSGAEIERTDDGLTLSFSAEIGPEDAPVMSYRGSVTCSENRIGFRVEAKLNESLETARTGFVVLHPLENFMGAEVTARSSDSDETGTKMPRLISPGQPLRGFRSLAFDIPETGMYFVVDMDADQPFEMEDQRNWTDASFKTYYRPLALPWPYTLGAGETLMQEVSVRAEPLESGAVHPQADEDGQPSGAGDPANLPSLGLTWLATDNVPKRPELIAALAPGSLAVHLDLRTPDAAAARLADARSLTAALSCDLHLRLILPDDAGEARTALARLDAPERTEGLSVMGLPAAFLASHQPDGPWPEGLDCATALDLVREHFPDAQTAEGMLTFFPEFNRHPPTAGAQSVTFGTGAIVHAADDISVMETLEALPSVFASAAALAAGRPIDVGLAAIGLWSNPYGGTLTPNPDWSRVAMTDRDPRQRGVFGACWLAGYICHAARYNLRSVGVGTVSGPLGLLADPSDDPDWRAAFPDAVVRPAWHVVRAMSALGTITQVQAPQRRGDPAVIAGSNGMIVATTGTEVSAPELLGTARARLLDPGTAPDAMRDRDWSLNAPLQEVATLGPYAVAFVREGEA